MPASIIRKKFSPHDKIFNLVGHIFRIDDEPYIYVITSSIEANLFSLHDGMRYDDIDLKGMGISQIIALISSDYSAQVEYLGICNIIVESEL